MCLPSIDLHWGGEEFDAAELSNGDSLCVFRRLNPDRTNPQAEVRWQGVLRKSGESWEPCPVRSGAEATLSELRFNTTGGGSAGVVDAGLRVCVSLDSRNYVIAGRAIPDAAAADLGICRGVQMVVPLSSAKARYVAIAAMSPAPHYFVFVNEIEILGVTPADPKSFLPVQPGLSATAPRSYSRLWREAVAAWTSWTTSSGRSNGRSGRGR